MVAHDTLRWSDGASDQTLTVDTPRWYDWLASATSFSFASDACTFTARKERFQRGGWYWKAYCWQAGKLHRVYLGKSQDLTLERLTVAAHSLAGRGDAASGNSNTGEGMSAGRGVRRSSRRRATPRMISTQNMASRTDMREVPAPSNESAYRDGPLTKMRVPPLSATLVPRVRLMERFEASTRGHITLLSAPAGSGKTTVLCEWLAHSKRSAAWVSLDVTDNDPAQFWRHLLTAIELLHPGIGQSALQLLRVQPMPPIESILPAFINALLPLECQVVLILDDYHVITTYAIHAGLGFLLDHLPSQLHLVVASRTNPTIPLARLRLRGHLTELGTDDLRFTPKETSTFLTEVQRLALSTDDVALLHARTEGWIAGLQLAALSLQRQHDIPAFLHAFTGSHRAIADFLLEEVLQRQPMGAQRFLLQTAILDRLSAPLCNAVTSQMGSQALLEWLERANLFLVPLDDQRHWYRYHHLFAEFLRQRLHHTMPEQMPALHARASVWHEQHGFHAEAIQHALAASDFNKAAQLVEQSSDVVLRCGEYVTMLRWIDALPAEVVRARPRLCLVHARALTAAGQLWAAETCLRILDAALAERAVDANEQARTEMQHVCNEINAIRADLAFSRGNAPQAIDLCRQVLARLPEQQVLLRTLTAVSLGRAYVANGEVAAGTDAYAAAQTMAHDAADVFAVLPSLCGQAVLLFQQGHLHQAVVIMEQALRLATELGSPPAPVASLAHLGMGLVLYEANELDPAMEHLQESMEHASQWGNWMATLQGLAILTQIKQVQNDLDSASLLLQQVEQLAYAHPGSPQGEISPAATCAWLWLGQGNVEAASRWIEQAGISEEDPLSVTCEVAHIALARVLLAQGKQGEVLPFLERLYVAAMAGERVERAMQILTLKALALHAQRDTAVAVAALKEALVIAEPLGYIRTFADQGMPMHELLLLLSQYTKAERSSMLHSSHRISPAYLQRVLAASSQDSFLPTVTSLPTVMRSGRCSAPTEALFSEREYEVIRLLVAGKSNQEIAGELVLAVSTVKWYLESIYGKLNVHSRLQAVHRVRDLQLL